MRPLLRCFARPMKEEWKIRPYLGVLPRVFRALRQQPSRLCIMHDSSAWTRAAFRKGLWHDYPHCQEGVSDDSGLCVSLGCCRDSEMHCRPEESLLSPQDLHRAGRVLCQVDERPCK